MILSQIEQYWSGRAKGYSEVNQYELTTGQDRVWLQEIERHLPKDRNLKILDVGRLRRMPAHWQKRFISTGWMPKILNFQMRHLML